jgi:hypothetical protein
MNWNELHSILDLDTKYVIVGIPKCGQVSLETYLKKCGYDVERHDNIWRSNAREIIEMQNPGRIPIIITRDPIQMIWSSYWYWHYKDIMSFPDYLKYTKSGKESSLGNENPIEHADYEKHINKFLDMKPILLKFEDLIKIDGWPHENKTEKKPELPLKFRQMIEEALESYKDQT